MHPWSSSIPCCAPRVSAHRRFPNVRHEPARRSTIAPTVGSSPGVERRPFHPRDEHRLYRTHRHRACARFCITTARPTDVVVPSSVEIANSEQSADQQIPIAVPARIITTISAVSSLLECPTPAHRQGRGSPRLRDRAGVGHSYRVARLGYRAGIRMKRLFKWLLRRTSERQLLAESTHPAYRPKAAERGAGYYRHAGGLTDRYAMDEHIISTNEGNGLIRMLLAGLGVGQHLRRFVQSHLDSGELVAVLEDWTRPSIPFHIVYPPNRHQSARLKVFAEWVLHKLAPENGRSAFP